MHKLNLGKTIYRSEYIRFLEVLKSTREERGLSQSELGMLIGQDQTYVSKYEKAIRRLDVIETLDICNALEINLVTFFETIAIKGK